MSKDPSSMLSFILGNDSVLMTKQKQSLQTVNRKLIMSSAMFWDSKKRVQKIKTLFLNSIGLKQFDDTEDFKIYQLQSIELLSLTKNKIIHMQPISQLNTLLSLNVSFNKVYDLSPLTKLEKLQELYASNNDIKTIEPLKELKNLKNVQLYRNKIHNFKQTFDTITVLSALNQLDIQQNPVASDKEFIQLISSTFSNIKKLNGQINKNTQKMKEMGSSKGFMNTSMKGFGTTSMFFTANSSTVNSMDPEKTFYNFCKKKSSNNQSWEKRKEKENILQKLENHYKELDDDFQKQIVKNVRLKSRLYKLVENKKLMQNQKEDNMAKSEQTKHLKRKVKALKEQLFTKDRKGELLRKLFEVQLLSKTNENGQSSIGDTLGGETQSTQSQFEKLQQARNQTRWTRRFQADEVIVIESNHQYLGDQTDNMHDLLGSIDDSIRQLKSDIDYLS